MSKAEPPPVKTPRNMPLRWCGFSSFRVPMLLVTPAWAAALLGLAVPAHAEPADPYTYVASATDDTFLRALDHLGIEHPNDAEAVNIAKGACAHIQSGHSVREAVDGVRNSYPGMALLQGAHFVAVARGVFCPDSSSY